MNIEYYRIAKVGTKGENREYLALSRSKEIEFVGRKDALHWSKPIAKAIVSGLNTGLAEQGRDERLQIERA